MTESTKKPQGFATLSPEQHRAICKKGGDSAHAKGTAYKFDTEKAKEAGKKGGLSHSAEHMARDREEGRESAGREGEGCGGPCHAQSEVSHHDRDAAWRRGAGVLKTLLPLAFIVGFVVVPPLHIVVYLRDNSVAWDSRDPFGLGWDTKR